MDDKSRCEPLLASRPVSPSDRTINRDDFIVVDHGINSVRPMLHQLGARSDQGERSNLVIDRLDTLLVEMGEAQFDHVTIPQLVVVPVDLLVAESREGASKAMGAMLGSGIIADYPQPLVERVVGEGLIVRARENVTPVPGQLVDGFEDFYRLSRQGYDMILLHLHLGGRHSPARLAPIDLGPLGIVDFAWSHRGERQEPQ